MWRSEERRSGRGSRLVAGLIGAMLVSGCVETSIREAREPMLSCVAWLRELEKDEDTVVTGASTYDNPFLAADALKAFLRAYANKPEASRQELYGEYIDKIAGALLPAVALFASLPLAKLALERAEQQHAEKEAT